MPNIAQFDPYKVQNISVLKKPNAKQALELLESISKQVQPILRRRKWKVPQLSEFFPRSNNLLGLNIGGGGGNTQEIKIRLRRPHDECSFYDHHHVMGTMLHELAHNIHSPHNDEFFKLWDELWEEVEDLMDKGISGSGVGFDAPSVGRLGGRGPVPVHNPDPRKLRDVAVKAAQERARKQALMPRGAQRLGGAAVSGLTPAQAAARAAERRARSDKCCPSGAHGTQNVVYDDATGEVHIADGAAAQPGSPSRQRRQPLRLPQLPLQPHSRAGPSFDPGAAASGGSGGSCGMDIDGAAAVIDLTQDDDDSDDGHVRNALLPHGSAARSGSGNAGASGSSSPAEHDRSARVGNAGMPCGRGGGGSWACEACTLVNSSRVGQCAACGTAAPGAAGGPGSGRTATPVKFHMGLGGSSGGGGSGRQRRSGSDSPKRDLSSRPGSGAGGRGAGSPIRMGLGGSLAGSRQGGGGGGGGIGGIGVAAGSGGLGGSGLGGRPGCWSCRFCTLANPEAEANCGACGEWRFATGLPSASRPTVEQKM